MLRRFFLATLLVHLAALAATQSAYGAIFSSLRWLSLFALFVLGGLSWVGARQPFLLSPSINWRVAVYLVLWGLTVINAEHFLFSGLRWAGHAMIVVSTLVFVPALVRARDTAAVMVALKALVAFFVLLSYFFPAALNVFDDPNLFRGIFGNPNALGHMSAVAALLFFHGFISARETRWSFLQGAVALFAALIMLQSGARSSLIAFVAGFLALYVLYKAKLSKYLVLAVLLVVSLPAAVPGLASQVEEFVFKHSGEQTSEALADRLLYSRQEAWSRHWEGFIERPITGWGFGIDRDADFTDWRGEWTSSSVTGRDPVNDVMYSLESGGLMGVFAYVFLMAALLVKGWFPSPARTLLDALVHDPNAAGVREAYDAYRGFYAMAVMLLVLFQWDNTAFAVGNFFAGLLWTSLGLALAFYAAVVCGVGQPRAVAAPHDAYRRPRFGAPGQIVSR